MRGCETIVLILLACIHQRCSARTVPLNKRAAFYIANGTVCNVDGKIYQNNDRIPTDNACEICHCRPPGFACVLQDCELKPHCKAVRREGQCCPDYQCAGCEHDGVFYEDGQVIPNTASPCYTCYCQGSSITCSLVSCQFRSDCQARYNPGECCPRYDHCPPKIDDNTTSTITSAEDSTITTTMNLTDSETTETDEVSTTTQPTTIESSARTGGERVSIKVEVPENQIIETEETSKPDTTLGTTRSTVTTTESTAVPTTVPTTTTTTTTTAAPTTITTTTTTLAPTTIPTTTTTKAPTTIPTTTTTKAPTTTPTTTTKAPTTIPTTTTTTTTTTTPAPTTITSTTTATSPVPTTTEERTTLTEASTVPRTTISEVPFKASSASSETYRIHVPEKHVAGIEEVTQKLTAVTKSIFNKASQPTPRPIDDEELDEFRRAVEILETHYRSFYHHISTTKRPDDRGNLPVLNQDMIDALFADPKEPLMVTLPPEVENPQSPTEPPKKTADGLEDLIIPQRIPYDDHDDTRLRIRNSHGNFGPENVPEELKKALLETRDDSSVNVNGTTSTEVPLTTRVLREEAKQLPPVSGADLYSGLPTLSPSDIPDQFYKTMNGETATVPPDITGQEESFKELMQPSIVVAVGQEVPTTTDSSLIKVQSEIPAPTTPGPETTSDSRVTVVPVEVLPTHSALRVDSTSLSSEENRDRPTCNLTEHLRNLLASISEKSKGSKDPLMEFLTRAIHSHTLAHPDDIPSFMKRTSA